jgi:hypothetical protein
VVEVRLDRGGARRRKIGGGGHAIGSRAANRLSIARADDSRVKESAARSPGGPDHAFVRAIIAPATTRRTARIGWRFHQEATWRSLPVAAAKLAVALKTVALRSWTAKAENPSKGSLAATRTIYPTR